MNETVILIICGILFVLLLIILIWWLKVGKQHFIEKRCPERLVKEETRSDLVDKTG